VGMLARWDVFRTITIESPDWPKIQSRNVVVGEIRLVKDITRRDTHTVVSGSTLEEIMRVIDSNDIQRVAVIDEAGKFLGLISDHDLLRLFSDHKISLWDRIASKLTFTDLGNRHKTLVELAGKKTAAEIMKSDIITIEEEAPIEEAIRLMTEKHIKRLPVVDENGNFKGMVSRDSILRTALIQA